MRRLGRKERVCHDFLRVKQLGLKISDAANWFEQFFERIENRRSGVVQ